MKSIKICIAAIALALVAMGCLAPLNQVDTGNPDEPNNPATPDTTAPAFSTAPALASAAATGATITLTMNEAGSVYWIAVADGAQAPTIAQVKATTNYDAVVVIANSGTSGVTVSADTSAVFTITGLSHSTNYDIWLIGEDAATNLSNPVKVDLTTAGPSVAAAVFTAFYNGSSNGSWIEIKINQKAGLTNALLLMSTSSFENNLLAFSSLPFWASVADGQSIRVWEYDNGSVSTDTAINAGTAGVWDYKIDTTTYTSANFFPTTTYGTQQIFIDTTIIDFMFFEFGQTLASWTSTTGNAKAVAAAASSPAQWGAFDPNSSPLGNAIHAGTKADTKYFKLVNAVTDGNSAADWEYVTIPSIAVSAVSTNPVSVANGTGGNVTVSATVTLAGTTSTPTVTADVSTLGGSATLAMTNTSGSTWTATYNVPGSVAVGSYSITVNASLSGLSDSDTTSLTVTSADDITVISAAFNPSTALRGTNVDLTVNASEVGAGNINTLTADLTSIGGGATVALTESTPGVWTLSGITIDAATGIGSKSIPVTATDTTRTDTSTANASINVAALAFANSDMEADMHSGSFGGGLTSSSYEAGQGRNSSRALHVTGTSTGNVFIFTSTANFNAYAGAANLVLYLKGTVAAKALSVQCGTSGSSAPGDLYPFGVVTGDKTVSSSSSHSYTGSVDTAGNWIKITMPLVLVDPTPGNNTNLTSTFAIKVGSGGVCDFYIDDIWFE